MNLTLHFRADAQLRRQIVGGQVQTSDVEGILIDMERRVRWFEALGFPLWRTAAAFEARNIRATRQLAAVGISTSGIKFKRNDPPIFLIVFGSFLVLRGYMTNVSLRWQPPFHPTTVRPYGCTVNISFQRLDAEVPTWHSIRNSAGGSEQTPNNITGTVKLTADDERALRSQRQQKLLGAVALARINGDNIMVRSTQAVSAFSSLLGG